MKKSSVSRRKFLTGMGLAAGAAALTTTVRPLGSLSNNGRNLLDAWSRPIKSSSIIMNPVRMLTRKRGSNLLTLAKRPF